MSESPPRHQWAARVSRYKIWQLYRADAAGRQDEELADEVGWALLARIRDCLLVTEAHRGRVPCPICGAIIERAHGHRDRVPDEVLACPHGHWSVTWREFRRSYRNKHLGSAGLETFFRGFAERYPRAETYGEKMVLIDTLLHRYHWELEGDPGGPGATNLIGGTREEVIAFLNQLTYGEHTTPGLTETKARWLRTLRYGPWRAETVDELSVRHRWPTDPADDT
jgi:hypothetical protein